MTSRIRLYIVDDKREQASKCTLGPALPMLSRISGLSLEVVDRGDLQDLPKEGIVLSLGGDELTYQDRDTPIILTDARWKYARRIERKMADMGINETRKIIGLETGYPRKDAPEEALSSLEALFTTLWTFGYYDPSILGDYYWRKDFLKSNSWRLKRLWPHDIVPAIDEV